MLQKENQNEALSIKVLLLMAIFGLLFFNLQNIFAAINCEDAAINKCTDLSNEEAIKCLDKTMRECKAKIDSSQNKQDTLENQLSLIDQDQQRNKIELGVAQKKLSTITERINSLEKEIKERERMLDYDRKVLVGLMQSYYEYYQQGLLEIVLIGRDFSETMSQADYIEQSGAKVNEILVSIKETKSKIESEHEELKKNKIESDKLKENLLDRNYYLQANEYQKQYLLTKTQGEESKYRELVAKAEEEKKAIEQEINDLEAGKVVNYSNLPPTKSGYFTYPVNPVRVTQSYGKTSYSSHYVSGLHNGIDFGINYSNIYAAKGGKILATGDNGKYAYGKWVAIDHGDGLVTLYGHLSKLSVSKGNSVKEGEKIATSGNTGYSTGPHLHFSVFSKNTFEIIESSKIKGLMLPTGGSINPTKYL